MTWSTESTVLILDGGKGRISPEPRYRPKSRSKLWIGIHCVLGYVVMDTHSVVLVQLEMTARPHRAYTEKSIGKMSITL